ncbi:hypothetical protein P7C70_g4127, partial [Phenoliferia sp. Uapishka_3]
MRASSLLLFSLAAGAIALPGSLSSDSSYPNKKLTSTTGSTIASESNLTSTIVTTLASSAVKGSITATKTSSVTVVTPSPTKFSVSKAPIEIAPASQWLLDPAFEITSLPQTRYYNFTIDARWGQPDGLTDHLQTIVAPSPKSGLINSVGIFDCSFAPAGSTCEQKTKPLELIYPSNTKIRLRLINAGMIYTYSSHENGTIDHHASGTHALFRVSADEHTLKVIEADDTPVHGPEVHRVPIYTAQRYSAVLDTAQDKSGDSFFLRAQINTGCFAGNFTDLDPDVKAIIRIADIGTLPSLKTPKTIDWNDALNGTCVDLDDATLVPRIAVDAPRYAGTTDVFNAAFNLTPTGDGRWFFNGVTFENFMYNPLLHQVYHGKTLNSTDVTNFVVPKLEAADLIINNALGADHPFHLHGLKFWVVGRGNGTLFRFNVSETIIHTKNPLRRDTLTVPNGQFAVIRVLADIPGVHAFHVAGLFGVFVVQPDAIRKFEIPDEHFKICEAINYEAGDTILTTDAGRRRRSLAPIQSNSTEFPLLNQQGGSPIRRAAEMWKRAEVVQFAKEV